MVGGGTLACDVPTGDWPGVNINRRGAVFMFLTFRALSRHGSCISPKTLVTILHILDAGRRACPMMASIKAGAVDLAAHRLPYGL